MNNLLFRVLLTMIHFGFLDEVLDVEIALLYKELAEKIFMNCPPCMNDVQKKITASFGKVYLCPWASTKTVQQEGCKNFE